MAKKPSLFSIILWMSPIIASTTYTHFKEGPPAKSWSLKYYLMIALIRAYITGPASKLTPQQMQKGFIKRVPPPAKDCQEIELTVPCEYRQRGGHTLGKILSQQDEALIGWNWRTDRSQSDALQGAWIQPNQQRNKNKKKTLLYFHGGAYFLGTYKMYRPLLGKLAILADANVFTVDYRLAPDHPFPTALEDALAAYMYLLDPPKDALFDPIPSSQIVISGDSAGGGLTMSLLICIRDSGLPMPAGAIPISPWLDLTHSLPSCRTNQMTDYLPNVFNSLKKASPLKDTDEEKQDDMLFYGVLDETLEQIHLYTHNRCLKHPLVSPLFDRYRWHGLPPLLIQTGDAEQLRDESICASFKATDQFSDGPPSLDSTTHLKRLPLTQVTLDLYDDQPHVFQLLMPSKSVERSIHTMAAFLSDIESNKQQQQEPLTIRSVAHDGQVQDVTKDMIKIHAGDTWQDWEDRLDNTSLKSRFQQARL